MGREANDIKELFETFLQKYPEWLEESMRGREFILIVLIDYITIFKKQAWAERDHI